tara:strand:+ start:316 stop:684 length:369 start_codon:yes stop_codon:yes gene_type:complete
MASLGVRLPLMLDSVDGFSMIKDIRTLVRQNLKMLILTNPGERVMEPLFGAGIRRYLFENFDSATPAAIDQKIRDQVSTFMPAVSVLSIAFSTEEMDFNKLAISITYAIPDINVEDLLQFTI